MHPPKKPPPISSPAATASSAATTPANPRTIGNVLAQLITARGYGRIQADCQLHRRLASKPPATTLAKYTRPGRLRRGILEVTAGNSMTIQELTFQKQQILNTTTNRICPTPKSATSASASAASTKTTNNHRDTEFTEKHDTMSN